MKKNLLLCKSAIAKTLIIAIVVVSIVGIAVATYVLSLSQSNPSSLSPSPALPTTSSSTRGPNNTPDFTPAQSSTSRQTPISSPSSTDTFPQSTHAPASLTPTSPPISPFSPSITPTSTPTLTQQPSTTPRSSPTPAPNLTQINMENAITEGLVQASVSGVGLTSINITLKSTSDNPLEVTILPGTVFESQSAGVQNMVVLTKKIMYLEFRGTVSSLSAPAACASMDLAQPNVNNVFIMSQNPVPGDLIKLLNLLDFQNASLRIKQFGIWTITDNPPRDGYMGLRTGFAVFGTGPSNDEMQQIRVLFEKAEIPTYRYQAFQ